MKTQSRGAVEQYRRDYVAGVIANSLGKEHANYSDFERLINGATRDAADQAVAAGHFPSDSKMDPDSAAFEELLHQAIDPIDQLYWSFPREDGDNKGRIWRHHSTLLADVKGKRLPEFQRRDIEQIAGSYVRGSVKTATVDRLMVDLLMGMEYAQYADIVINAPHVPFLAPNVLKRGVIFEWFFGRIIAAVLGYLGYLAFWGLQKIGLFPEGWLWIVGLILTCLWVLDAAWGTIMLPKVWLATRKAQQTIRVLLDHMSQAYSSLASEGPVSAQHVTGLVARGTEAGVVWPGPLHVLLEDINARGGRF